MTAVLATMWRLAITAVLLLLFILYLRGWRQLRPLFVAQQQQATPARPHLPHFISLLAFCGFMLGLILLAMILLSPVHRWAFTYFSVRVTQRLLLAALIPALLLSANPQPVLLQGLPHMARSKIRRWFDERPQVTARVQRATAPGIVWLTFAAVFWLGYDSQLQTVMQRIVWLRYLEMSGLLLAALLYWWHITQAAPRLHQPMGPLARVAFTLVGTWPIKIAGLIMLFAQSQTAATANVSLLSGLHVSDRDLGAVLIWLIGGLVYTTTAVYLMRRWLRSEEKKEQLPEAMWGTEEAMIAPGFGKQAGVR